MGKELFKNIPSKVEDLVKGVRNGRIGLPDLQRPFVWKDNKVRELLTPCSKGILLATLCFGSSGGLRKQKEYNR